MSEARAMEQLDRLLTPPAPVDATLTTAGLLQPGDRITQGRGSRYKGPDLYVRTVAPNRVLPALVDVTGTGGEHLTAVPADFAYYVHRGA